jgi:tetratricopeptide (TPR) repeat protein
MAAKKNRKGVRFDIDRLQELAGDKVFARGEEYYDDGQVQILTIEPGRVLAQVAGSEDYRTELRGRGETIEGHCSCRAYSDWGFCKHMVAVGLAANAAGDGEAVGGGAITRIRDHLGTMSADSLADMIVDLAERDPQLFRRLELAAAASQADDPSLEVRLRKAIDGATRAGTYVDYSSAPGWAAGVDEVLNAIGTLASGGRAALALKLAERAFDRIEQAVESIDDSNGYCGALLSRARDIHLAAALEARPEPVQLARDLFAREMNDGYDIFWGAAAHYAEVLGERGLAEYRRLAEVAWQKVPCRSPSRSSQDLSTNYHGLVNILDFFAERDGDIDARIALRTDDLSSPYSYLQLAEFCLSQGRKEDALRYATEGLLIFEDGRQDERLVVFATDLLAKAGRREEAEAQLWRAFEKTPSLALYARLGKAGGEAARKRALQTLESLSAQQRPGYLSNPAALLIEILTRDKAFDRAWGAVHKFGGSIGLNDRLAKATEKTHPGEALRVYEARVEQLATSGGSSYAEAVQLISRMARLRSAPEQAIYVAALKERHGRKRNFMKLLG